MKTKQISPYVVSAGDTAKMVQMLRDLSDMLQLGHLMYVSGGLVAVPMTLIDASDETQILQGVQIYGCMVLTHAAPRKERKQVTKK